MYKFACKQSPKTTENRRIRFESHRVAIATPMKIRYNFNKENSISALDNMKNILSELKDDCNYKFYELTYFTQHIGLDTLLGCVSDTVVEKSINSFINISNLLLYDINKNSDNNEYLLGSWQQLNSKRSKYNQAKVGAGNYIISLVNAGRYKIALDCYYKIESFNLFINNYYFNKKIQFAQSQCNISK